jgi:hypothetical protein
VKAGDFRGSPAYMAIVISSESRAPTRRGGWPQSTAEPQNPL